MRCDIGHACYTRPGEAEGGGSGSCAHRFWAVISGQKIFYNLSTTTDTPPQMTLVDTSVHTPAHSLTDCELSHIVYIVRATLAGKKRESIEQLLEQTGSHDVSIHRSQSGSYGFNLRGTAKIPGGERQRSPHPSPLPSHAIASHRTPIRSRVPLTPSHHTRYV